MDHSKEEKQRVPSFKSLDAGVVESIVQRLNEVIEHNSKIHRPAIAVKPIRPCIPGEHLCFERRQTRGAVISLNIQRPRPSAIISLLRQLSARTPLCASTAQGTVGNIFRSQRGPAAPES